MRLFSFLISCSNSSVETSQGIVTFPSTLKLISKKVDFLFKTKSHLSEG